jgi:hypothetical protein
MDSVYASRISAISRFISAISSAILAYCSLERGCGSCLCENRVSVFKQFEDARYEEYQHDGHPKNHP